MEILLSLLILGLGLMGVLVLFPMGIDAARVSTETTRAATIARMAKAALLTVNDTDKRSPFDRILDDVRDDDGPGPDISFFGPWFLPHNDETFLPTWSWPWLSPTDPDAGSRNDDGPASEPVVAAGEAPATADYSWSIAVAYPYDADGANPDYLLNGLWQNDRVLIVQVTVYRKFSAVGGQGKFTHNSIVVDSLSLTGAPLESVRGGDWVRFLNRTTAPWSGDGFWYRVDQVDAVGQRVKLDGQYWGREGTPVGAAVPLEFTDRIVGTYTFLLSAE